MVQGERRATATTARSASSGTYRVSESAAAGTSLDDYATSIACTVNGSPGPSASGTTQLDVTVGSEADIVKCALTNKRKARVTLTKHLVRHPTPAAST